MPGKFQKQLDDGIANGVFHATSSTEPDPNVNGDQVADSESEVKNLKKEPVDVEAENAENTTKKLNAW